MERKIFYTLQGTSQGGFKIVEKDGFEFVINGEKFNAYKDEYGDVYIIDPETGRSFFKCYVEELPEMEAVRYTKDQFVKRCFVADKAGETKRSPRYQIMVEMFKAFKSGAELGKKLRYGTLAEMQES